MKTEMPVTTLNPRQIIRCLRGWKCAIPILLGLLLLRAPVDARAVSYVFQIPSANAWTDTGLDLAGGSEVIITASGTVQYGFLPEQVTGPNGGDYTGAQFFPDAVLPNTFIVSLVGKVGGSTAVGTGAPIPEGAPGKGVGFVGASYDQVIPTSGRLFLGFNDRSPFYFDNSGSFSVNVTVVPEPSSLALIALGGSALLGKRWLRRAKSI